MHIRKGGKFMKLKKKSGLMGAVIALSAASLISVGFASWVISQGDTKTVDGQIIVDTVNDVRHVITITGTPADIKFAAPAVANQTIENHWLTSDGAVVENLIATFNVSITNVLEAKTPADVSFTVAAGVKSGDTFTAETDNTKGYAKAQSLGLVGVLPAVGAEGDGLGYITLGTETYVANSGEGADTTRGTMSFDVTLNFVWGSAFNYGNPYTYYNTGKTAADYADQANTNLQALKTWLSGVSYRVTVEAPASL